MASVSYSLLIVVFNKAVQVEAAIEGPFECCLSLAASLSLSLSFFLCPSTFEWFCHFVYPT